MTKPKKVVVVIPWNSLPHPVTHPVSPALSSSSSGMQMGTMFGWNLTGSVNLSNTRSLLNETGSYSGWMATTWTLLSWKVYGSGKLLSVSYSPILRSRSSGKTLEQAHTILQYITGKHFPIQAVSCCYHPVLCQESCSTFVVRRS